MPVLPASTAFREQTPLVGKVARAARAGESAKPAASSARAGGEGGVQKDNSSPRRDEPQ